MLNCSNYFLLISLAIISWIFLCLSNSKPSYVKFLKEKQETQKTAGELSNWPETILYSVTSVNSSVMIYIACTLFGVFIIVNIVKRKMNSLSLTESISTIEASVVSLKYQLSQLKLEKTSLLTLVKQYKLEKKFLIQHVTFNKTIIQKLLSDLRNAKEQLDTLRCNYYISPCISSDKSIQNFRPQSERVCNSSTGIVDNYFRNQKNSSSKNLDKYDTLRLTLSNRDVINGVLMEAFNGVRSGKNRSQHFPRMGHASNEDLVGGSSEYNQHSFSGHKRNNMVNIVSTDQLEVIKGLY
ncbi:uncharacterized protein LOC119649226 isoform X1 [Hermetia illucens]|uniref:uncharacterized protein LOC119649226 isoform X1 n=1 Tax=Hermetia illucens TaxID=343691 RepID=UPI0018CBF76F|nr:uncharacterized protein LOC119649226 isoform X1 [Hermetia illucens]